MTKREAKRNVLGIAVRLLEAGTHENDFLYYDKESKEYPKADQARLLEAWTEFMYELETRSDLC